MHPMTLGWKKTLQEEIAEIGYNRKRRAMERV